MKLTEDRYSAVYQYHLEQLTRLKNSKKRGGEYKAIETKHSQSTRSVSSIHSWPTGSSNSTCFLSGRFWRVLAKRPTPTSSPNQRKLVVGPTFPHLIPLKIRYKSFPYLLYNSMHPFSISPYHSPMLTVYVFHTFLFSYMPDSFATFLC